jgi:hypothetical protein
MKYFKFILANIAIILQLLLPLEVLKDVVKIMIIKYVIQAIAVVNMAIVELVKIIALLIRVANPNSVNVKTIVMILKQQQLKQLE